jgi:hypothetical protein
VRATIVFVLAFCCIGLAHAQAPADVGSPESAFAGGPIRLSRNAAAMLRAHYQGDKVPLIPQPFRGRLDTALLGRDWPRVEAEKKALATSRGIAAELLWEQSRFIATGSIGVAEMHALDLAATGQTGVAETAVMLWFYAVAVTLTDGHKCVDEAAKDAHLDRLRGPAFDSVTALVRSISDDRLAAMRDLAIRLETVLAVDRTDDLMCRTGDGKADVKPDAQWRPEAAMTRGMLSRHLVALASIMRPHPISRPVPPVAVSVRPGAPGPRPTVEPVFPGAGLGIPLLPDLIYPVPGAVRPGPVVSAPEPVKPAAAEPAQAASAPPGPATPTPQPAQAVTAPPTPASPPPEPAKPEPVNSEVVNRVVSPPDPAHFDPPQLELTTPAQQANH